VGHQQYGKYNEVLEFLVIVPNLAFGLIKVAHHELLQVHLHLQTHLKFLHIKLLNIDL
jgi:hypothetical protein